MPALMSVGEFVTETKDDFNSPTTSTFVNKMPQCRQTVATLEESLDFDRDGLTKMKKAVKAIHNSGNVHIDNEIYLSKALERMGANAMTKDQEPDIGAAFIKFSIVTKELSGLMKTLMQNLNNIVMFPLDNILKGDLKGVKGDLKKPFDKACRDYETKISKIEKEKKQQAKEAGLIRTEISPAEIAEEMDKERKIFQLHMCEYLLKVNEIKSKKGVELLQHLVEYYNAQTKYFADGLNAIEQFRSYINDLTDKINKIKQKQEDDRKVLNDLKHLLKSSSPFLDNTNTNKDSSSTTNNVGSDKRDGQGSSVISGYSLHQMQGNKNYGYIKSGYLLKKSEGKMRVKVWQKRKCEVKDGYLLIYHSDESKSPTKVNLLTCQIKAVADEKKSFDLISYNRTYHFQTEDENELEAWTSVLVNCKEGALKKEFDSNNQSSYSNTTTSQSLNELRQSIINQIQKLPGNDRCVDCNSTKDPTWLATNFGVLTCIECSGIHRDMGVHISRIQSLNLDNIGTSQLLVARVMSNSGFNDVMEAKLNPGDKPNPTSSMEIRNEFIRAKYIERKFAIKTCSDENDLKIDLENAVLSRQLLQILQAFSEGADLTWILPDSNSDETSLHLAVSQEDGTTLHVVDFLVQNSLNLNKVTKDGNTALHYCVIYDQVECMKLLLRSGADINIKNSKRKTPLDLAKEKGSQHLIELLESAVNNKKSLFENVNINWNVHPEDPSTDFSDEDLADDKQSANQTPQVTNQWPISYDRYQRSRPSSVVGNESPSNKSNDSYKQKQCKMIARDIAALHSHGGSIKKRSAPPAPPPKDVQDSISQNNTISKNHSRTSSDCGAVSMTQHFRNHSADLHLSNQMEEFSNGNKSYVYVKSNANVPSDKQVQVNQGLGSLQRPKCPPPPAPAHNAYINLTNGQSVESLPSGFSEYDDSVIRISGVSVPIPPPRKRNDGFRLRRCLALYDCEADREDELAFKEGEVILIINEKTDDDEWMEGIIEGDPNRRGVFPVSFVHFLKD